MARKRKRYVAIEPPRGPAVLRLSERAEQRAFGAARRWRVHDVDGSEAERRTGGGLRAGGEHAVAVAFHERGPRTSVREDARGDDDPPHALGRHPGNRNGEATVGELARSDARRLVAHHAGGARALGVEREPQRERQT